MTLQYSFDDEEEPTFPPEYIDRRVDDWLMRLDDLFGQIRIWASANGWTVTDGDPAPMREKIMERAGVKERTQPSLFVRKAAGQEIWIRPKALWVIGANGRIDIYAGNRVFTLVDIADHFQPPRWVLHRVGGGTKGKPFDPKLLAGMV